MVSKQNLNKDGHIYKILPTNFSRGEEKYNSESSLIDRDNYLKKQKDIVYAKIYKSKELQIVVIKKKGKSGSNNKEQIMEQAYNVCEKTYFDRIKKLEQLFENLYEKLYLLTLNEYKEGLEIIRDQKRLIQKKKDSYKESIYQLIEYLPDPNVISLDFNFYNDNDPEYRKFEKEINSFILIARNYEQRMEGSKKLIRVVTDYIENNKGLVTKEESDKLQKLVRKLNKYLNTREGLNFFSKTNSRFKPGSLEKEIAKKFERIRGKVEKIKKWNAYKKEVRNFLQENRKYISKDISSEIYSMLDSKKINNKKLDELLEKINIEIDKIRIVPRKISKFLDSSQAFLIIEGMAGTGKTEAINELVSQIKDRENIFDSIVRTTRQVRDIETISVSAPSKVAVANIRQRDIYFAKTFQHVGNAVNHHPKNYKNLKYVIVDEASMITPRSLSLFIKGLKKIPGNDFGSIKFVFIGDKGQIRPYDFNDREEKDSVALNARYLTKVIDGYGDTLNLIYDHRFRINDLSNEFIEALKWLRTDPQEDILTEFLNKLPKNSKELETIKEKNEIINIFNETVSLGTEIREMLANDEYPDYTKFKKREESLKDVGENEFYNAVELYRDQKERRPELGKLYSKIFPKLSDRLKEKADLAKVIVLHRSNEQVRETNLSIRPHLFENFNDENILEGELLTIENSPYSEDEKPDEQIFAGETVVVLSAAKITTKKEHIDDLHGDIWKLQVRPIMRLQNRYLAYYAEKIPFINSGKRSIYVWDGALCSTEKEPSKLFDKDTNKIKKTNLVTDDGLEESLSNLYMVKYAYARTNFTAQGGEWDNIIIQTGDVDWKGHRSNARFFYTAATRMKEKIYFV